MWIEWMDNKMETIHFKTFYFASESQGKGWGPLWEAVLLSKVLVKIWPSDYHKVVSGYWKNFIPHDPGTSGGPVFSPKSPTSLQLCGGKLLILTVKCMWQGCGALEGWGMWRPFTTLQSSILAVAVEKFVPIRGHSSLVLTSLLTGYWGSCGAGHPLPTNHTGWAVWARGSFSWGETTEILGLICYLLPTLTNMAHTYPTWLNLLLNSFYILDI